MFTKAIVRRPCKKMVDGITSANLGKPDYNLAMKQHDAYIQALEKCGLEVELLEADNNYPDSVFVEDTALCTPKCAIITNPGASSRKGEVENMKDVLEEEFGEVHTIKAPGCVDGGDIMMVGNHYFVGLSNRTNLEGANQLASILKKFGYTASVVKLNEVLHLKTGVSYLEKNNLLVSGEFINMPEFKAFKKTFIIDEEKYAANSLWINDTVLVPKDFPDTLKKIKALRYRTIELDMSEFRKLDGGLSCLSLRF